MFDDCFFDGITHKFGVWKSFTICHTLVNGRWFGNFTACIFFYLAGHNFKIYALILTIEMLLFVLAAAFLYKNYLQTFRQQKISRFAALAYGFVFTAILYFLMYTGRREVWGWLDSATVHLQSVILCMFLFGLLIRAEQTYVTRYLVVALAFCLGGLNEMNAICSFLLISILLFLPGLEPYRLNRINLVFAGIAITLSLLINYTSAGYRARMGNLPGFTLPQSLKNTLHTFLMPLLELEWVPLLVTILLLGGLIAQLFVYRGRSLPWLTRKEGLALVISLGLICTSFFLHCYTLSDVVPARGALWGYALFLFTVSVLLLRKKEPISYS